MENKLSFTENMVMTQGDIKNDQSFACTFFKPSYEKPRVKILYKLTDSRSFKPLDSFNRILCPIL